MQTIHLTPALFLPVLVGQLVVLSPPCEAQTEARIEGAGTFGAGSAQASAPALDADETADAERLGLWLHSLNDGATGLRIAGGVMAITLGAALSTVGVVSYANADAFDGIAGEGFRFIAGPISLLLGVSTLSLGIAGLTIQTPQEDLFDRWQVVHASGLTTRQLGVFEGELRGLAERASHARTFGAAFGLAYFAGGAAVLLATPFADGLSENEQTLYYITGATFAGIGALGSGLLLLVRDPSETAWEEYKAGRAPEGAEELSLSLAPNVNPFGGGLALQGTF